MVKKRYCCACGGCERHMVRWAADSERRTQWAKVFLINESLLPKTAYICIRHFADDQYTLFARSGGAAVRLNDGAIPTIVIKKQFGEFKFCTISTDNSVFSANSLMDTATQMPHAPSTSLIPVEIVPDRKPTTIVLPLNRQLSTVCRMPSTQIDTAPKHRRARVHSSIRSVT